MSNAIKNPMVKAKAGATGNMVASSGQGGMGSPAGFGGHKTAGPGGSGMNCCEGKMVGSTITGFNTGGVKKAKV